jgi:hypothetical protein
MSRCRSIAAVLGALLLGLPIAAHARSTNNQPAPKSESGNPINDQGSNYNYRSTITEISPSVPGLTLEVLQFADRLVLENHSGKTVTVYGYQGEPYARIRADGVVEENKRSPAYYLNQNFYGDVNVPSFASSTATPRWFVLDRTGQFEWHDHRIHWMSPVPPAKVKNKSKRTLIFDWQVPISVGAQHGGVDGQLFWVPEEGTKTPVAAIVALIAILLAGLSLVFVVRKRRRTGGPPGIGSTTDRASNGASEPAKEAW